MSTGLTRSCLAMLCAAVTAASCGEDEQPTATVTAALLPLPLPPTIPIVSAGGNHSCTVMNTGTSIFAQGKVRCWGLGDYGQLGYGNTNEIGNNEFPSEAGNVSVRDRALSIASGGVHTCVLLADGSVQCWGLGGQGRLGYGNTTTIGDNELPFAAGFVNVGGVAVQIDAGEEQTCVLLTTGNVRCWGAQRSVITVGVGYGPGDVGDNESPASMGDVPLGAPISQIAVGGQHICALRSDATVQCWGFNYYGQLGYGNTEHIGDNIGEMPPRLVNVGRPVMQITAGGAHTCALVLGGQVRCWGLGSSGQLGYGNTNDIGDNETPASAGNVPLGATAVQVAAGRLHTCAVLTDGAVRCWGRGDYGQLGYGNTNEIGNNETPASAGNVNVGGSVARITAGDYHTCAVLTNGAVRCWGLGDYGQLGYGNTNEIGNNETPASAGNVPLL